MIRLKNHRKGGVVAARDWRSVCVSILVALLVLSVLGAIGEQDRQTRAIEWGCR